MMIEFVIVRYEIRNKFVIFRLKTRVMQSLCLNVTNLFLVSYV